MDWSDTASEHGLHLSGTEDTTRILVTDTIATHTTVTLIRDTGCKPKHHPRYTIPPFSFFDIRVCVSIGAHTPKTTTLTLSSIAPESACVASNSVD